MKFVNIPQLTKPGNYKINVGWNSLEDCITRYTNEYEVAKLDMNPDFQRAHVWTTEQQRAFVEFKLRGGQGSDLIMFNCVGWMNDFRGPFVLVDGKQRLEAVLKFLRNELSIFNGYFMKDFEDPGRLSRVDFVFMINDLPTRADVLQWYIDINVGGTVHTQDEIDRVKALWAVEKILG